MTEIIHDTSKHRFTLALQHGHRPEAQAVLEYVLLGQGVIDFKRTYVPFAFRGKGFAEALVEAGLNWARQQGYEITASCWFVQKFLDSTSEPGSS